MNVQPDEDRGFLRIAALLFDALESWHAELVVVRVREVFGPRWLRFSGKGRVAFEHPRLDHPGVSLAPFRQDGLTFPPFSPGRVVSEQHSSRAESAPSAGPEALGTFTGASPITLPSLLAMWISTGSETSGRGCVMTYSRRRGAAVDSWSASFRRGPCQWRLERTKGIPASRVTDWLDVDGPPSETLVRS